MSLYLYINIAILMFPLAISFEKKRINYHSKMRAVALSIISVGALFVAWDALATHLGHWSFNSAYIIGIELLGLPLEEVLFFVTVPFSCLFTYEALAHFHKDTTVNWLDKLPPIMGTVFILLSPVFINKQYTFLACLSVGLSVLLAASLVKHLFSSELYWFYIATTFVLFLVFNFILTSLPIVEYSNEAITGLRVTTIPVEDFMFNFSMLTLHLAVYLFVSRKLEAG